MRKRVFDNGQGVHLTMTHSARAQPGSVVSTLPREHLYCHWHMRSYNRSVTSIVFLELGILSLQGPPIDSPERPEDAPFQRAASLSG